MNVSGLPLGLSHMLLEVKRQGLKLQVLVGMVTRALTRDVC
jgi:hypothetical protein